MINIAFKGGILEYGGSPSAISIQVIPNDQISVFLVYLDFEIISGLIQKGVPITVLANVLFYISAATPKSANLAIPCSFNKIFPALISR
jgi:hypothetical protein